MKAKLWLLVVVVLFVVAGCANGTKSASAYALYNEAISKTAAQDSLAIDVSIDTKIGEGTEAVAVHQKMTMQLQDINNSLKGNLEVNSYFVGQQQTTKAYLTNDYMYLKQGNRKIRVNNTGFVKDVFNSVTFTPEVIENVRITNELDKKVIMFNITKDEIMRMLLSSFGDVSTDDFSILVSNVSITINELGYLDQVIVAIQIVLERPEHTTMISSLTQTDYRDFNTTKVSVPDDLDSYSIAQ